MATMSLETMFSELDLEITWDWAKRSGRKIHDQEVAEVMSDAQEDYFPGQRMVLEVFDSE